MTMSSVQDVDALVSNWILQLQLEQFSTGSQLASVLSASFCGLSEVHLRFCPNFPVFRTCGYFLACIYDSLRLFHIYLHDLRNSNFVPSGNDAANRLSESSLALLFLSTWLSFLPIIFANYSACAEGLYFFALCFHILCTESCCE